MLAGRGPGAADDPRDTDRLGHQCGAQADELLRVPFKPGGRRLRRATRLAVAVRRVDGQPSKGADVVHWGGSMAFERRPLRGMRLSRCPLSARMEIIVCERRRPWLTVVSCEPTLETGSAPCLSPKPAEAAGVVRMWCTCALADGVQGSLQMRVRPHSLLSVVVC